MDAVEPTTDTSRVRIAIGQIDLPREQAAVVLRAIIAVLEYSVAELEPDYELAVH